MRLPSRRQSLLAGALLSLSAWGAAEVTFGLRTRLNEFRLSGLNVGETYNLRKLKNLPYVLENTGDEEVNVEANIMQPSAKELREGYEPIADPNWVSVIPRAFKIPYRGSSYGEIVIAIPNDPRYINRHFQAVIHGGTRDTGLFSVGVRTNVLFSTGSEPVIRNQPKIKVLIPEYDIDPPVMSLYNFPVGRPVDIDKELRKVFRVINKSEVKFKMSFARTPFGVVDLPGRYESAPSSVTVRLSASELKLGPESITKLGVTVQLPADAHEKRYAFLFKGQLVGYPVDVTSYVMVLLESEKKSQ